MAMVFLIPIAIILVILVIGLVSICNGLKQRERYDYFGGAGSYGNARYGNHVRHGEEHGHWHSEEHSNPYDAVNYRQPSYPEPTYSPPAHFSRDDGVDAAQAKVWRDIDKSGRDFWSNLNTNHV